MARATVEGASKGSPFAREIDLVPSTTPVTSPQSDGMTETTLLLSAAILLSAGICMHGKSNAEVWQRYVKVKFSTALSRRSVWFLVLLSFPRCLPGKISRRSSSTRPCEPKERAQPCPLRQAPQRVYLPSSLGQCCVTAPAANHPILFVDLGTDRDPRGRARLQGYCRAAGGRHSGGAATGGLASYRGPRSLSDHRVRGGADRRDTRSRGGFMD